MSRIIALSATIALFSGVAMADSIELSRPLQAGSLHDGAIDMVIYYDSADAGLFEVVGTYATRATPHEAYRIRLGLAEGEQASFSLPGERHMSYIFARKGDVIRVSTLDNPSKTAQLTGSPDVVSKFE